MVKNIIILHKLGSKSKFHDNWVKQYRVEVINRARLEMGGKPPSIPSMGHSAHGARSPSPGINHAHYLAD